MAPIPAGRSAGFLVLEHETESKTGNGSRNGKAWGPKQQTEPDMESGRQEPGKETRQLTQTEKNKENPGCPFVVCFGAMPGVPLLLLFSLRGLETCRFGLRFNVQKAHVPDGKRRNGKQHGNESTTEP